MNLIRNLVGLIISLTMVPICVEAFIFGSNIPFDYSEIEDEIALCQLREELLISYDMDISDYELNFRYKNKDFKLSLVNNKLLLQPGSQMYLNDIDELKFKEEKDCIYVVYERQDKQYERIICKKKGLYIDEFSDCDVLFNVDNSD